MTELLSTVRCRIIDQSCFVTRCRKDRCSVSLPQSPARNRLIIDCDQPGSPFGPNDTKCDCLLFEETPNGAGRAIPIELKSGRIRASAVIEQLQAGAQAVENLLPREIAVQLQPLLAYGNIPKGERAALSRGVVWFRGDRIRINKIRCGAQLP